MNGTLTDFLNVARHDIGYSRWDDPQQGTKYGRWYAKLTGEPYFGYNGVYFCAMGVSYWLNEARIKVPGFPGASCGAIISYAKAHGAHMITKASDLKQGDIIFFDWNKKAHDGADHVGIVEYNKGSYLQTIEANVDNGKVARKTRAYSTFYIGIRPTFGTKQSTEPKKGKYIPLKIDGDGGPRTVYSMQEVMKSRYLDGEISGQFWPNRHYFPAISSVTFEDNGESELVRLIQKALMVDPDGYIGAITSRAFCASMGFPNKYSIDAEVIKEVQRRLNKGYLF